MNLKEHESVRLFNTIIAVTKETGYYLQYA